MVWLKDLYTSPVFTANKQYEFQQITLAFWILFLFYIRKFNQMIFSLPSKSKILRFLGLGLSKEKSIIHQEQISLNLWEFKLTKNIKHVCFILIPVFFLGKCFLIFKLVTDSIILLSEDGGSLKPICVIKIRSDSSNHSSFLEENIQGE